MTKKIECLKFISDQDENTVQVPLSRSDKRVTLYESDFEKLIDLGVSPKWCLHVGFPKVYCNQHYLSIARLIADAGVGQKIILKNGNVFDLRRDNLIKDNGSAKIRDREHLLKSNKFNPNRPTISFRTMTNVDGAGSIMT